VRSDRQRDFQRNERLEELLGELNSLLGPIEDRIVREFRMPKYPVVLVLGAPRCGATLMMQWLAHMGRFAYPTNLLSRFYGAPYLGAKIQQLLTAPEYSFRDEILDFSQDISFSSDLGKTKGALAPNEFWYFWRRFIPNAEPRYVDEEALQSVDAQGFVAELAAIESVFDRPFAMKGLILELNVPFLSSLFEKVLFVFVKRHPFYNIQSLLEARVKYFGDRRAWYSIKPREYDLLEGLDPIEQVAGQVYYTNRGIEDGLAQIDASRRLVIDYEMFCAAPAEMFDQIVAKFAQQGYDVDWDYTGPVHFQSTNQVRLQAEDCARILAAYRRFSGEELMVYETGDIR
jgi:hypothetical protein